MALRVAFGQQVPVTVEAESGAFRAELRRASTARRPPSHVAWLRLNVAAGGVTVSSQGQLAGLVRAPAGQVTINAPTFGAIAADRLIVNSSGRLVPGQ